jgi:hypothetical protein
VNWLVRKKKIGNVCKKEELEKEVINGDKITVVLEIF